MTKDEMKNRISMVLKNPILQQGFEIICKENVELEAQNKELKTVKIPQLERRIASIRGCHSVGIKKLNARIEQVERLKKQVSAVSKALVNVVSESDEVKGQLTKAKEIIRKLSRLKHHTDDPFTYEEYLKLIKEVEQFLKED